MPSKDSGRVAKDVVLANVRIYLAGRAAEMVFWGDRGIDAGASADLEHATRDVLDMLCYYGMEDGFLASVSPSTVLNGPLAMRYLDKTNEILQRELSATIAIIAEHKACVKRLGDELLRRSRLNRDEMAAILSEVGFVVEE